LCVLISDILLSWVLKLAYLLFRLFQVTGTLFLGKGVGHVVCGAVERDERGSIPGSSGRFLSTEGTCVLTL